MLRAQVLEDERHLSAKSRSWTKLEEPSIPEVQDSNHSIQYPNLEVTSEQVQEYMLIHMASPARNCVYAHGRANQLQIQHVVCTE